LIYQQCSWMTMAADSAIGDPCGRVRSLSGGLSRSKDLAMSVSFIRQNSDGCFGPVSVSRFASRLLLGHSFGAIPAPCGSSLFCFGNAALQVTVSGQILFAKCREKISPEPP
jgi:hypothetical protein